MATFRVPVARIRAIEPIPNADAIELAVIGDYRSVVRKGQHAVGDLAVYIPEASVMPGWLLQKLGLWDAAQGKGKLAGAKGNRVKATKLRGSLSQGIVYPLVRSSAADSGAALLELEPVDGTTPTAAVEEGQDCAGLLGIVKYEPPIPAHMGGELCNIFGNTLKYDIENLKAYPDVLQDGEEVAVTEKIHGTFCCIGVIPGLGHPELFGRGDVYVCSKGLGAQGLVFKNSPGNARNLYVQALESMGDIVAALQAMIANPASSVHGLPVHIMGEIFGQGVQDLSYGLKERRFRAFEVYVGKAGQGRYLEFAAKRAFLAELGIPMVDVLYVGPYSRAKIAELRDGKSVTGGGAHIREGVVVTPAEERYHNQLGRVILKDVSEAYLLRKNGTEFN